MAAGTHITCLTHSEIDTHKWDKCIDTAVNGRIYAYSWYLNHMAKQWQALVLNDYEAVMPLPWKSKYGIRYIYQPFLTAHLGIFGNHLTPELAAVFIDHIPRHFRLVELSLNSGNPVSGEYLHTRTNFVLPLQPAYTSLAENYNNNTQRNCRKAWQNNLTVQKGFNPQQVINLALVQMKSYHAPAPADNIRRFQNLLHELLKKKSAITYGIFKDEQLLSAAIFFLSHKRAYYILVGNHPDSKQTSASHALIDAFIKDNAATDLILDFEGSDIPGLATFYAGFGAQPELYPFLKINRLPFFLKWLKK